MELQHFSHTHPLLFNEELSHESDEKVNCAGCGELLSGPNFSCLGCKFYLHKQCAEAPSQINHPFHPNHSFKLLKKHPYSGTCPCDFCGKPCENFVYHCSSTCQLDLHIKCALLSNKIADKRIAELQHIPRVDPLISMESCNTEELKKAECFACWKPLLDSVFLSPDCGFYLHTKCLHLTAEINHLFHSQHPLVLQFNSERLPCTICQKTQWRGLVYCCSSCEFVLHIHCSSLPTQISQIYHRKHPLILQFVSEPLPCPICQELIHLKSAATYFCSICKFVVHSGCASPPSSIEDKVHHDHPFILVQRHFSIICDACGTSEKCIPYICLTCNIIVHKKCISLPRIIRFYRHEHCLFRNFFLAHESETLECRYCHDEVKTDHGSYFCSKCNYIIHVNCALKTSHFYYEVEQAEEDEAELTSYSRVTATCIKHFSHDHNLAFSEDDKYEKQCDGCSLFISAPYYYCLQCDFFLHKYCAELPMKEHILGHYHQKLWKLTSAGIFICSFCLFENSGFSYSCDECTTRYCVRCISVSASNPKCKGHKHPVPLYEDYTGICNACGASINGAYRCKTCDFNLGVKCRRLPLKVRHKSDDHLYTLTYHENSDYSERYYCDICEKKRNPNYWFYHCLICDNSAHRDCVIRKYSYIKLGSIYSKGDHSHPLTFVQKIHYYPECDRCGKSCLDLALECKEVGCNYIAHWECIKPAQL